MSERLGPEDIVARLERVRVALGLSEGAFAEKAGYSDALLRTPRRNAAKGKPTSMVVRTFLDLTEAHDLPPWVFFVDDATFDAFVAELAGGARGGGGDVTGELGLRALHNLAAEAKRQRALLERSVATSEAMRDEIATLREVVTTLAKLAGAAADPPPRQDNRAGAGRK